jgi:hypothetical protein
MNQLYSSSSGLPSVIRNWLLEECELIDRRKALRRRKREKPQKRFEFPRLRHRQRVDERARLLRIQSEADYYPT